MADPGDAGAGRLGARRDDGHLLADQAVEQRGLAHVGPPDEGHEARPMRRRHQASRSPAQSRAGIERGDRRGQDLARALVHPAGAARLVIVVAGQVQEPVHDQQVQLGGQRHPEPPRLARRRLHGDDHLAPEPARTGAGEVEREHVGGPADAEIARVERPDAPVVHHRDVDLTVGPAEGGEGPAGHRSQALRRDAGPPLQIGDRDRHGRAGPQPAPRDDGFWTRS